VAIQVVALGLLWLEPGRLNLLTLKDDEPPPSA
jgi:hypothetical protein